MDKHTYAYTAAFSINTIVRSHSSHTYIHMYTEVKNQFCCKIVSAINCVIYDQQQ